MATAPTYHPGSYPPQHRMGTPRRALQHHVAHSHHRRTHPGLLPPARPRRHPGRLDTLNSLIPALALTFAGLAILQLLAKTTDTPPSTIGAGMPADWRGGVATFLLATLIFQM